MQRHPGRIARLALFACALVCAAPAPLAAGNAEPRKDAVTVLPRTFLRGYDPITVFFTNPRGPARPGPEDRPEKVCAIEPAPPGEYRWLDAKTLIFKPAAAWPPLVRYRVAAEGQTRTLVTLMVRPEALEPSDDAADLEPFSEVTLTFPDPIEPADLARMVSFEVRELPGVERSRPVVLGAEDFRIKVLERGARSEPARYVFQLKRPVEHGRTLLTRVRLALDDPSNDALATFACSTKETFRVLAVGSSSTEAAAESRPAEESEEGASSESGSGEESAEAAPAPRPKRRRTRSSNGELPGMLPVTVAGTRYTREQAIDGGTGVPRIGVLFSAEPAMPFLSEMKTLLRFSPAIPGMTVSKSGSYLWITGQIERDTVYQATLGPAPIKDRSGRTLKLEGPSEFYFYFPARPSYLRWARSQGIVERFGPQMFPMSARTDGRVDLRIHRVDPLDRNFWPFPANPLVVDESARPPGPGEEPPSADTLTGQLSPADLRVRLLMLGSPPVSELSALPVRKAGGATGFGLPLKEQLASIAGADQPGTYLVGIRRLNGEKQRSYVRLQVTDLCLTTVEEPRAIVFLVTSLKTGLPVPGASLAVEGLPEHEEAAAYISLVSGATDARGQFRHEHRGEVPGNPKRIVVKKDRDTLVLLAAEPPYSFANNHWHRTAGAWLGWLTSPPPEPPTASSLAMAHLLTERPVYRPEEPVHIKGLVRVRDAGRLSLPPHDAYELTITAPGGRRWKTPVEVSPEGSFYHKFADKELPTGDYTAVLTNLVTRATCATVDWKTESYTIPRFEVELFGPDRAPLDRPFTLTATAKYYSGGRVVGEPTRWRVMQQPYVYVPEAHPGFVFSSDERFSKSGRFASPGTLVRNEKTDDSGASALTINPAIELDARPRRYMFEVTVTGPDEQTVTNTRQVIALPPFVLGLDVERFQTDGKPLAPRLIAVDPDGKLLAGQEVTVRLLQRQWHSTLTETDFATGKPKYATDVVDREIFTTKITTKDQPLSVPLPAEAAGIYLIEVSSRDKANRLQLVSVDLYRGGAGALAWKKPEANVFETVPDKASYAPGDTARILLKSPYQTAQALAVVEGPDGNVYQELAVEGGKAVFTLQIKNEYNPRLPVHFVLRRGRVTDAVAGKVDLGKPGTMAATVWLKIEPRENRLDVKLTHPEKALPGQEISVTIKLTTPDGKPAAGEVALWLVDQAVLSLGRERELDPLPSFIREVKSNLAIRDTRNSIIGEVVTEENPGGGGAEEPGLLGRITPRKKFQSVPYYNPSIRIDGTGVGTVTFKLSDDLTNFKIRAVAASLPDRFGFAKSTIAVRLPVLVQPALPRFVRISDTFTAGGIGRVVEGEGGAGRFEVKAEGATVGGERAGPLALVRDKPARLFFPFTVQTATELKLTLALQRDKDGARDAFEVTLPVRPDREPVRAMVIKKLMQGQSVAFPEFDRDVRPGSVEQEAVITDQEAVLKMVSALDYLYDSGAEGTEQRVSRCYPALALRSLLDSFKLAPDTRRTDERFGETIAYLGTTLQPNGLYSFWPGTRGQVSLTAYVLPFLVEAKKAGRAIPARLIDRPITALQEALRSDYSNFVDGSASTERCEALRALSAAGVFDESYGAELAKQARTLTPYGGAQVLLAFNTGQKGGGPITEALRSELWDTTVFKLRDGQEVFGGLQSRYTFVDGLVLDSEIRTLAGLIRSLYPAERENPRMKMMVEELVRIGAQDGWGNTATNAAALLALKDVVATPRRLTSAPRFEVTAGAAKLGFTLDDGHPTVHFVTRDAAPAQLAWTGGAPNEAFFAKLDVTCTPRATGDTVAAESAGFVVRNEVIRVPRDDAAPVKAWVEEPRRSFAFQSGDVVEEHVQVVNAEERHYVAVVAPLAAGMEPLNPNLKTSPPEARPSGSLTLEPSYSMYLDDEVRFYYETLPAGTYDLSFRTRATTAGSFVKPGARAEMLYRPTVRGHSPGSRYEVEPAEGR